MKKILFLILFISVLLSTLVASAQGNNVKPNVFIDYFSRPSSLSSTWAEAVRNQVIEGLMASGRIEMIDVDSRSALKLEGERRNQSNISEGADIERLAVMVEEGANFIITGTITNFSINSKVRSTDNKTYYAGTLDYTLKLINPNDGKLVLSKNFKHGTTFEITGETLDECGSKMVKKAHKSGNVFAETAFPVKGTILELGEQKKGEVKNLYISVGSAHGINKKTELLVYVVRDIAGRKSRSEIGKIQVEEIQGEDITLCKVKDGKKEILNAFNNGQEIEIETIPMKEGGGILGGLGEILD